MTAGIPIVKESIDPWEWEEQAFERQWTDGGVVVAPTEKRVRAVLDYLGRDPNESLGTVPPGGGDATVEQVAVNCVMAGCLPEHVPVVMAALEAALDPAFNLRGLLASTDDYWPLVIVSGPAVDRLGFSSGFSVFAGGNSRANATVGRALRLILWNIGGYVLGRTIRSTLGHQGQFSYCIAENQEYNPWEPLHTRFGFAAEDSVVTLFSCDAPHDALGSGGGLDAHPNGTRMLNMICNVTCQLGQPQILEGGQVLLALAPACADILRGEGWTKRQVQEYIFHRARKPLRELKRSVYPPAVGSVEWPQWVDRENDEALPPFVSSPGDVIIAIAGGNGQYWNSVCHGWGNRGGFATARAIRFPV